MDQLRQQTEDFDVFDRLYIPDLYILDKETHYIAKFKTLTKNERRYTPQYKNMVIKGMRKTFQTSLELSPILYNEVAGKLKKAKMLSLTDFTKPSLERLIPNVCQVTYPRTCLVSSEPEMIDRELSCRYNGEVPNP
jgi:hypothetical protein